MQTKKTKPRIQWERNEQEALIKYFAWQYPGELMFAIPNQLVRSKLQAILMSKQGLMGGLPDICIPSPKKPYHGLYIELKAKHGVASTVQKNMINRLNGFGYLARICYGWIEAKAVIDEYFKGEAW